jgi:hypothetical protein
MMGVYLTPYPNRVSLKLHAPIPSPRWRGDGGFTCRAHAAGVRGEVALWAKFVEARICGSRLQGTTSHGKSAGPVGERGEAAIIGFESVFACGIILLVRLLRRQPCKMWRQP